MSDTISQPYTSHEYHIPGMGDFKESDAGNPAAAARDEYEQHAYTDYMATPDLESQAVENGIPLTPIREGSAVNAFESVPSPQEVHVYLDQSGNAIDPQHAEAVLNEARRHVDAVLTPLQPEQYNNAEANRLAELYGPYVENVRDYYTIKWGGESLN